jgi:hypothetical protein
MQISTPKISQQTYRTLFWLFLILITTLRLLTAGKFGLGVDESHYLLYSRHLDWGYFDHPPMVAFLAAGTALLGDSVLLVRAGPILCSVTSLALLRYLALALYEDEGVGFWSAILIHLMPYQHLLLVGLLPDAALNLFWCATLLAGWHALKSGKWSMWILTGLMLGGALLSKYHSVLLVLCLFGYLLTSQQRRFWLTKVQPYTAMLIGLLLFVPNILWNARHDWISYSYQLGQGSGDGLDPGKFLLAVGGQLGAWSPVIFGLLLTVFWLKIRQPKLSEADRFAVWTSIPIFGFFCLAGLTSKVLPHWTSVGWWTGSVVVASMVLQKMSGPANMKRRWRRWVAAAAAIGLAMTALLYGALFLPLVEPAYTWARSISLALHQKIPAVKPLEPYETGFDISNELFGWRETARQVELMRSQMPHPETTFVFGHRFHSTSQVSVYLKPATVAATIGRRFDQYRLWFDPTRHRGWDALFIVEPKRHRQRARRYRPLFENMDAQPQEIRVFRKGRLARTLMVYKYYGFRGKYEE